MSTSTEQSLRNELERLVAQRERYQLAAEAATNARARERHARNLERLEDEILGLQEALQALSPPTIVVRGEGPVPGVPAEAASGPTSPVPAAAPRTQPIEAGAPQVVIAKIDSWPISEPRPVATTPDATEAITDRFRDVSTRSIIEPKTARSSAVSPPPPRGPLLRAEAPRVDAPMRAPTAIAPGPTPRDSGLFATPTQLPVPRALQSTSAPRATRPARWPDRITPAAAPSAGTHSGAGSAPIARRARPRTRIGQVVPRAVHSASTESAHASAASADTGNATKLDDLSTLEPRRILPTDETEADAFDAVLLRRRIAHQAAKVMTSAFAVGFVVAAVVFAVQRGDDAAAPGASLAKADAEPVLASSNN